MDDGRKIATLEVCQMLARVRSLEILGRLMCHSRRPFERTPVNRRGKQSANHPSFMNPTSRALAIRAFAGVVIAFACTKPSAAAERNPVRQPVDDVNSAVVRRKEGLQPNENLLFNGWGVTPAGDHVAVSDMALKMVVAPDKRRLVAVSGGFSNHGVTLIDIANRKVAQFLSLTQCWNGLAFSKDGGRFYVSGGASGFIHVFKYSNGEAAPER